MRGVLTPELEAKWKELTGDELTRFQLRLMPYISYTMQNNQRIDPNKINTEEREVLKWWRGLGYIEGGASGLTITREFYDNINEIIWLSYVNYPCNKG